MAALALMGCAEAPLPQVKPAPRPVVMAEPAPIIAPETPASAAAVPGDTHRNLQVQTEFSEVGYKGALLPVWIAAYQYGGKTYRFLVNGATGKVAGKAPVSWPKILIAVGAVLLLLLIFANL